MADKAPYCGTHGYYHWCKRTKRLNPRKYGEHIASINENNKAMHMPPKLVKKKDPINKIDSYGWGLIISSIIFFAHFIPLAIGCYMWVWAGEKFPPFNKWDDGIFMYSMVSFITSLVLVPCAIESDCKLRVKNSGSRYSKMRTNKRRG